MWRYSLLRLAGIIGLMVALVYAIVQTAQKNVPSAVLGWALVGVGLWVAIIGDKGIDKSKAQAKAAKSAQALGFEGHELVVGPKWMWVVLSIACVPPLAYGLGQLVIAKGTSVSLVAVVFLVGEVFLVGLWIRMARQAMLALSNGYLIKLDPTGLFIVGRALIPWPAVRGVDLRADEVKGVTHYTAVLALDSAFLLGGGPLDGAVRWVWGSVALEPGKGVVNVPLALLQVEPHLLAQAAKVIGDRYGARRLKNWRYTQPIEVAEQEEAAAERVRAADERLQSLMDQAKRMDKDGNPDTERLKKLDHDLAAAFGESTAAMTERVKLFETKAKQLQKQSRGALWGAIALVVFGLVWIVMKLIMAAGK